MAHILLTTSLVFPSAAVRTVSSDAYGDAYSRSLCLLLTAYPLTAYLRLNSLPPQVYRTPATLSTEPGRSVLPCLSQRGAAATPQLLSVSPLVAPYNSTLTLVGANLTGLASGAGTPNAPTVSVCGGRPCAVFAHNATHVQCRMPMCSAAGVANDTTLLHVPPYGYAQPLGDTAVRAVLSVTAAVLTSGGAAQGSAAGGVTLRLTGEGFADATARMRVSLRHNGGVLAACEVLPSITSTIP